MESAREHLELWLKHNAELARRQFESDIDALGKEMVARGLFFSGWRVKRAVALGNAAVTTLAKLAIDKAKTIPEFPEGLAMARASLEAFATEIIGRTDDVTREAMRGPGTDGVWREVRELQKPMTSDLATTFDLAKFDYSPGYYRPAFAASWGATEIQFAESAKATKLPSLVKLAQAAAWVVFRDERAATDDKGGLERLNGQDGAMQSEAMLAFDRAIMTRAIPVYGNAAGKGWQPVPVDAFGSEEFTLGPSRLSTFGDLYVMRADLLTLFPPDGRPAASSPAVPAPNQGDAASNDPAPSQVAKRLSDKALMSWWDKLKAKRDSMTQEQLLDDCRKAHPDHAISRERVRALTGPRKRGRPRFRGEETAN